MSRSVRMAGLFVLLSGVWAYAQDGGPPPPPPQKLVEWRWDSGMPKVEKTGKQIGGKDAYKLTASGRLIFLDNQGSVSSDPAKSYMAVYTTSISTPDAFPVNPVRKFTVTVGNLTEFMDGTTKKYYFPITAITTLNDMPTGDPEVYLDGTRLKVVPVLTYKLSPTNAEVQSQFDPAGYANCQSP